MATLEKELVVKRGGATVRTVADEIDLPQAAQPLMDQFAAALNRHTEKYVAAVNELIAKQREGNGVQHLAEPTTFPFGLPPYNWWNLVMAGPFQPLGPGAAGPFAPHKIVRAGEPAIILGAIWRNPAPINWTPAGPSATMLMGPMNLAVQFQTLNITTGVAGPTFVPVGVPAPLGFGNPIVFFAPLVFPAPADGAPHVYEINLVADVNGPIAGLPFAGYSTWHYDPDVEPPFLGLPAIAPAFQHDIPARILVYTA